MSSATIFSYSVVWNASPSLLSHVSYLLNPSSITCVEGGSEETHTYTHTHTYAHKHTRACADKPAKVKEY